MLWALAADMTIEEAFPYAMAGGAAALLSPGTELCHAHDVRRLVGQVIIEDCAATVKT